MYVKIYL